MRREPIRWSKWTGAGPTVDKQFLDLMQPPEHGENVSGWLHYFYFFGQIGIPPRVTGRKPPTIDEVLSGEVFDPPRSAYYRGPDGLLRSSVKARGDISEAHQGQTLALLGQCGFTADHTFELGNEVVSIEELIQSEVQTFNLTGEMEWSTTVLLHYLPPQRSWADRWGTEYSFSQIADILVSRELGEGPCGGTHSLQLLTGMLVVDESYDIIGPETTNKVRDYLLTATAALRQNQASGGGWGRAWHTDGLVRGYTNDMTLHITGHHLEWILDAPRELRPPAEMIELAVEACRNRLGETRFQDVQSQLCGFTHAIKSVVYYDQLHEGP